MKKLLVVEADSNDGDYVTLITDITNNMKIENLLKKVIPVIKNCDDEFGHNWPLNDCCDISVEQLYKGKLTKKNIEDMNSYIPYGENGIHTIESIKIFHGENGIHTIESIKIFHVEKEEILI